MQFAFSIIQSGRKEDYKVRIPHIDNVRLSAPPCGSFPILDTTSRRPRLFKGRCISSGHYLWCFGTRSRFCFIYSKCRHFCFNSSKRQTTQMTNSFFVFFLYYATVEPKCDLYATTTRQNRICIQRPKNMTSSTKTSGFLVSILQKNELYFWDGSKSTKL